MSAIKYKYGTRQPIETPPDVIRFASRVCKKALKTERWTYSAKAFVGLRDTNFTSYIVALVAAAPDGTTVCWMLRAGRYNTQAGDLRKEAKSFLAMLHHKNYESLWEDGKFGDEARAQIQRAHSDCWPPLERLANCADERQG